MDTPSKERLVGAIIFVVLIVLVVPEILSGPHHFASAGNAPAATPTRSYVIELGNPVKPAGSPGPEAKRTPLPAPPPAPGAQQLPVVTPAAPTPAGPQPNADPAPAPAKSTAKAPPADDSETWIAQLGSFAKAENAQRLVATLRKKGYRAYVSPTGSGSHVLHRVRVGPESSREAADALVQRLKRDGETATVVSQP